MLMVLYPAGVIITSSFETQGANGATEFGLHAWRVALSDPVMISAIWNTVAVTLARQAIALPIAILPGSLREPISQATALEFLFWLGYFPAFP